MNFDLSGHGKIIEVEETEIGVRLTITFSMANQAMGEHRAAYIDAMKAVIEDVDGVVGISICSLGS